MPQSNLPENVENIYEDENTMHIENPVGLNVMLFIKSGRLISNFVIYPASGSIYFYVNGKKNPYIHLEAADGKWYLVIKRPVYFLDSALTNHYSCELGHHTFQRLSSSNDSYLIYAEEVNGKSGVFHNYLINSTPAITIGRQDDNDICIHDTKKVISRHHAKLQYLKDHWAIEDTDSVNGVYVNGRQIPANQVVSIPIGSMINIMSLRIITGPGILSINDAKKKFNFRGI